MTEVHRLIYLTLVFITVSIIKTDFLMTLHRFAGNKSIWTIYISTEIKYKQQQKGNKITHFRTSYLSRSPVVFFLQLLLSSLNFRRTKLKCFITRRHQNHFDVLLYTISFTRVYQNLHTNTTLSPKRFTQTVAS